MRNSSWPDNIDRAESDRREAISFEGALAPVITSDDYNKFKSFDAQINMDIASLVHATSDGRRYVKEFNHTDGVNLGYASHNVSIKLKLKVKTCRNKHCVYPWKKMFQAFAKVVDKEMKGEIHKVAQFFMSLSFQEFYTGREKQADGLSEKRKFTPPSVKHVENAYLLSQESTNVLRWHLDNPIARVPCQPVHMERERQSAVRQSEAIYFGACQIFWVSGNQSFISV